MPTTVVRQQTTKIEVPQLISSRMHERFRWPADQVLLISLGVGPTPVPQAPGTLGMSVPLFSAARAPTCWSFVESRGKLAVGGRRGDCHGRSRLPLAKYPGRY